MEVSLPSDFLVAARKKAIEKLGESLEIAGFRKGHIPENIVIEKVGESEVLQESANIVLNEHFPRIIIQENLDIIGQPKISITKLALGNPIEFKAVFAILPNFELPDYKKIASAIIEQGKPAPATASEEEVGDVLLQIRKNKAHIDWHDAHKDEIGHNHPEIKDEDLPPMDDSLARAAGNFKNLDELKEKVKENIIEEKKNRAAEKKRAAIMEELIKNTKIELPDILVESEIEKSLAQMKDDVVKMGGPVKSHERDHGASNWEEYLAHIKKTEEDLKKDLRESSEKKAKIQLIFNKIAEAEKIEINKTVLENEVKNIMEHYKDASETSARIYVSTILLNTEVLKLLEN